jgi:hypothetical protein
MNSKTTAKDFFLYLGVIIGLYVSSISFLMLIFQIIDKTFPLAGEYIGDLDSSIRSSLAALIIFFPAFIYVSYLTNKDLVASPEKKDMWVRRWMIFFTLFVAGLTIAIDLTTLIYRFLGAEDLTLRFFLKVFFVLAVAATVFKFVLNDLNRTSFEITKGIKNFVMMISAVILVGIIYGMIIIGSPASQRAKMMDDQRINDLSSIQNQIVYTQWQNKGEVPTSLDALKDPISGYILPTDPETKESYEYRMISKNSFELCATFKTVSVASTQNTVIPTPVSYPYVNGMINENWQHKAERTCFTRTIDEKLYPINKNKL